MNYVISENRLQELVNNYFDSFEYQIDDVGGDLVVWNAITGARMFDTFGDNLLIESVLLSSIESLFSDKKIGNYILTWFNNKFDTNLDSYLALAFDDEEEDDD